VLFKLRPLALESQGLSAALSQLADKTIKTYNQNVVLRLAPDIEAYLDQQKQGTLFYLIEEAVSNARKYAQAETITIRIGRKNGMLIARIEDNGVGFETKAVNSNYSERGSFGMVNMRERAEILGGSITLESVPNQGTVITVFIPISDEVNGGTSTRSKVSTLIPKSKLALNAQKSVAKQVRRY
jgi:signal transduction histidine kinase